MNNMKNFETNSHNQLKALGFDDTQINWLENSQALVKQINDHLKTQMKKSGDTAKLIENNNGSDLFYYRTGDDYGNIEINSNHTLVEKLEIIAHELGHANNIDLVRSVDWKSEEVTWKTADVKYV